MAEAMESTVGALLGSLVMIWIRPALAFLPNNVPCGPRRTSTWSMSTRSMKAMPERARTTPSTMVETLGSAPTLNEKVPMPRITNDEFADDPPFWMATDGRTLTRSAEVTEWVLSI